MIDSLVNIFKVPDLKKRIFFTLGLLAVYRIGAHVPTPGIDGEALSQFFAQHQGTLFGMMDMFSGGALGKLTIFALGIMPYISASIILQLLVVVWPYLERLSKEGEEGRKKITQYTRYGTVVISAIQSFGIAFGLESMRGPGGASIVLSPGWGFRLMTVLTLTAGTAFIMWIGEQISERGIGNGISLIIFAGIVAAMPNATINTLNQLQTGELKPLVMLGILIVMFLVVAGVVVMQQGQRRIPVQYAKRIVGRKTYGGQSTHIPLRVNTAGVIPIIFASSVIMFPATIAQFIAHPWMQVISENLNPGRMLYTILFIASIIFFTYFYTAIIFNPVDLADNMKKYGGFVPGIRPGKRTAEFIDRALTRITFIGAIFLALISILPTFLMFGMPFQDIPFIGDTLYEYLPDFITHGFHISFYFGGTALLIVVGVALDTIQQIEAQLLMRHYEGFMKKGRIRGRR